MIATDVDAEHAWQEKLDSMTPPDGVKFVADAPEEVTIATLNPPRVVEEEEPELEEETGIVGEDEEEAEEAAAEDEGGDEGDSGSED